MLIHKYYLTRHDALGYAITLCVFELAISLWSSIEDFSAHTMVDLSVFVTTTSFQSDGYSKVYMAGASLLAP